MIMLRPIEPKALKDDVFRLELLNALRKAGTVVRKDYEKTTGTWQHKVVFQEQISLAGGGPSLEVWTEDQVYAYVNEGTRPHVIRPRSPGGMLAFPGTFTAKTVPGVIGSGPGSSGGETVFTREVHHPGTQAREFDKAIIEKDEDEFADIMQDGLDKAADKCGHSM